MAMHIRVLKVFSYGGKDGTHPAPLAVGDEVAVDDESIVPGLVKEGFVEVIEGKLPLIEKESESGSEPESAKARHKRG